MATGKDKLREIVEFNGFSADVIDIDAEWDKSLGDEENIENIKKIYHLKDPEWIENEVNNQKFNKLLDTHNSWRDKYGDGMNVFSDPNILNVTILGARGSGKTALGHSVCDNLRRFRKMPVYVYKHPNEELCRNIGYEPLHNISQLKDLRNAVIFFDEPQMSFKRTEGRSNNFLVEVQTIARHRGLVLVFSTCDTRWVNRELESYVDVWLIKDIDARSIKIGSKARYIIKDYETLDPDSFKLNKSEYLLEYRNNNDFHGKYTIGLPKYWKEDFSITHDGVDK